MNTSDVFANIDTSDPTLVAFAVMTYMYEHHDQLTKEEEQAIYEQMYTYGVPRTATPALQNGWPSFTG